MHRPLLYIHKTVLSTHNKIFLANLKCAVNFSSKHATNCLNKSVLTVDGKSYPVDDYTNVTPNILSHVDKKLHNRPHHPLCLLKQQIVSYFYKEFVGRKGTPIFSIYDNISPVVTVEENFDSLLVPTNHVSRNKSDCYYINRRHLLRAHTTAHQSELIKMGLDNFVVFGDVYRRDQIDATHYPVFHQADGVHLLNQEQISEVVESPLEIFERNGVHNDAKQAIHTLDATKIMETKLKDTLMNLAKLLFGPGKWTHSGYLQASPDMT